MQGDLSMENYEREINLKRLIYKSLKHWRVMAVAALVGAVTVGGTKCTVELVSLSRQGVAEERRMEYEGELARYRQEGETIRKNIEKTKASMTQQEEYNANSVLMKIDPYNEWWGTVDFYVETDYQIMPELTIQNPNPANQIVQVYNAYITNGELYRYINERLETPMELRYLREVLGSSVDTVNFLIHFTVRGVTEEECSALLTLVEAGMRAKQTEITKSVGAYTLQVTNSATYSQINYALEQSQKDNLQAITDLDNALSTEQLELLEWEWKEKEIAVPVLGAEDAVKQGARWAALTGLLAAAAVAVFYAVGYLLSQYVQDRDEFEGWGVYVVELPRSYGKRPFRWADRLVGRWFLGNVKAGEYELRLTAAAKQIGEAAKRNTKAAEPKLVLAGDIKRAELDSLAAAMQQGTDGVQFAAAGNPLLEVSAIDEIVNADGILLVAKQESTKKETLYRIREQLQMLGKQTVAVVLTNADAVV